MVLGVESRKEKKNVVVITVRGRLILTSGSRLLDEVKRAVEQGSQRIVVELAEVDYVDSYGLGLMVACKTAVENQKGVVRFAGLTPKVFQLIANTNVHRYLDFDPDTPTALARLTGS